jgi:CRP-like cAMP-binding protein
MRQEPMSQPTSNHFLARLAPTDRALIEPYLEPVELRPGTLLHQRGQPVNHVVFPLSGLVSIAVPMRRGGPVECAVVGREGIIGACVGSGIRSAIDDAIVQIGGTAMQISLDHFRHALDQSSNIRQLSARCDAMLMVQSHQSAACNAVHTAEARMSRWLLEFLAMMLGVRRTTVTLIAGTLQNAGAIRWRRGRVQILDRTILEASVCECYARVRQYADELLNEASVALQVYPEPIHNDVIATEPFGDQKHDHLAPLGR